MNEIPAPYGEIPPSDFPAQWKRLFMAVGCDSQAGLAEVLGIHQSAVSDAKRKQSIPARWLLTLFLNERLNPEWILSGVGFPVLRRLGKIPAQRRAGRAVASRSAQVPLAGFSTDALLAELLRRVIADGWGDLPRLG